MTTEITTRPLGFICSHFREGLTNSTFDCPFCKIESQAEEIAALRADNLDLRRDEALNEAEAKIIALRTAGQMALDAIQYVAPFNGLPGPHYQKLRTAERKLTTALQQVKNENQNI